MHDLESHETWMAFQSLVFSCFRVSVKAKMGEELGPAAAYSAQAK